MVTNRKNQRYERRKKSIRNKVHGNAERLRLTIFKSSQHIYAQIIDDTNGQTLVSASTRDKDIAPQVASLKGKIEKSRLVGTELAKKAASKNLVKVAFDRNGYIYHGRVKAVADAAREGGLSF